MPTQEGEVYEAGDLIHPELHHLQRPGKVGQYIGESARTGFDRGLEHQASVRRKEEGHPIVEHYGKEHPNAPSMEFTMEITHIESKNLHRQAREGHLIMHFKGDYILNGRGDWG